MTREKTKPSQVDQLSLLPTTPKSRQTEIHSIIISFYPNQQKHNESIFQFNPESLRRLLSKTQISYQANHSFEPTIFFNNTRTTSCFSSLFTSSLWSTTRRLSLVLCAINLEIAPLKRPGRRINPEIATYSSVCRATNQRLRSDRRNEEKAPWFSVIQTFLEIDTKGSIHDPHPLTIPVFLKISPWTIKMFIMPPKPIKVSL